MGHYLNFDPHIVLSESCHANTSPDRLVIWHPALEVAYHRIQGLVIDWDVVRVDPEHLLPALSARVFQVQVNISKGLVDLFVDLFEENAGLRVPATCVRSG